ncbi:hypothetical protein EYF80_038828 [Liparis tanakae]|uniref:LITAF domain-containing protein n=1 Tax=Liparis tanakae TaxID=230148 RepID=A0A4Z2GCV3_9TELE|nr:hypothetical protein EYF80_038828 [Liparis tanakae]
MLLLPLPLCLKNFKDVQHSCPCCRELLHLEQKRCCQRPTPSNSPRYDASSNNFKNNPQKDLTGERTLVGVATSLWSLVEVVQPEPGPRVHLVQRKLLEGRKDRGSEDVSLVERRQ